MVRLRPLFPKSNGRPRVDVLIGDRGYDSNKVRKTAEDQKVIPCIPPRKNRKIQIEYCDALYYPEEKGGNR